MTENSVIHLALRDWRRHARQVLVLPLLLFITLPLLGILFRNPIQELYKNLQNHQVGQAIGLSMLTSLSAVTVTILFGTPVACYLAQQKHRFHRLVDAIVDLPTVLPPAVAGVALLMVFGRRGWIGGWLDSFGVQIPFTAFAVILAQTFIACPFYIKSATVGFSAVNKEYQQSAAMDGANTWQIFRMITVPLSWSAMLSGAILTWARALGEFGATIIFAGNFPGRTQTMPLAIYIGFEIDLNVALTLSVVLICISFLTMIIVKDVLRRKFGEHQFDS